MVNSYNVVQQRVSIGEQEFMHDIKYFKFSFVLSTGMHLFFSCWTLRIHVLVMVRNRCRATFFLSPLTGQDEKKPRQFFNSQLYQQYPCNLFETSIKVYRLAFLSTATQFRVVFAQFLLFLIRQCCHFPRFPQWISSHKMLSIGIMSITTEIWSSL